MYQSWLITQLLFHFSVINRQYIRLWIRKRRDIIKDITNHWNRKTITNPTRRITLRSIIITTRSIIIRIITRIEKMTFNKKWYSRKKNIYFFRIAFSVRFSLLTFTLSIHGLCHTISYSFGLFSKIVLSFFRYCSIFSISIAILYH